MSKQKVMDDLDALLADLQLTSSQPPVQPCRQERIQCKLEPGIPTTAYASTGIYSSADNVTADDGQPIYELQSIRTLHPNNGKQLSELRSGSSVTSLPSLSPYTARSQQDIAGEALHLDGARSTATLSSNLSELDSLLQELSSAQFTVEVDRRTADKDGNSVTRLHSSAPRNDGSNQISNILHQRSGNIAVASSATKELDDLMSSLNAMDTTGSVVVASQKPVRLTDPVGSTASMLSADIESSLPGTGPLDSYPVPAIAQVSQMAVSYNSNGSALPSSKNQSDAVNLNALMDDLDRNMFQHGVSTIPKGHCAACLKPIVGQVVMALGLLWHPEHFTCIQCKEPLGTRNFFERDSVPYCERDYHLLFSPQCSSCNGPILDKCVTALDKTWHPEHFCCRLCGCELGDDVGFHEHDGNPYCREDYFEHFAPKCGGCSRPIAENFISALNRQWHPPCFVCNECLVPFGTGTFFEHNGMPYCETHFHAQRGSLCAGCHKPVTGRCITAMYRKYHLEHFVCTYCQRQLNKGTFKEENDMPYCHPCYVRLFS